MMMMIMIVYLFGFFTSSSATRLFRGWVPRLTILRAATHKTERGDHGFCLSRLHYTDDDDDDDDDDDHDDHNDASSSSSSSSPSS